MKVVVAIDSFKGCMTSNEVNDAVELGIKEVYEKSTIIKVPLADGGEGTVDTLISGGGGTLVTKTVNGPLMRPIEAKYGILSEGTAVIEMASAAGLTLLKGSERNPLKTTTYGVGELIKDAVKRGSRDIIIGIGGSATNDAGIGMLNALGYKFLDSNHKELDGTGQSLSKIAYIDDTKRMKELNKCRFRIACDVENPFCGPDGAAYIYGHQKGADSMMIKELDFGLKNLASVIKNKMGIELIKIPGTGAAGGLGGGLLVFLNGELLPGIQIIVDQIQLEEKIKGADFVLTGEGKMDVQSSMGKAPMGVAKLAKKYNVPVIGIAGSVSEDAYRLNNQGLTAIFSIINEPMTLTEAMDKCQATKMVKEAVTQLFKLIKSSKRF
ncbi:glycerate kinase family protein [Haloplasma contractile]|uniref:Glycerate kinase protein n=1 Tax=Haloplasma contractile SSD-17B TaxID=1033810 RepID=U2EDT3_9MOLU|nr:glycerate kinase [Haloplasma contractile]ERJ13148.1 glycerate kinase protein [Haloplasma contractile SSD-17B]